MKKLLIKASFFFVPFLILYVINLLFYNINEGDLVKVGYLYSNPVSKSEIDNRFTLEKKYTKISELNLKIKSKFDVVIIGDSFSGLEDLGYPNYLANKDISVLNSDFSISGIHPIQKMVELINSDFFDKVETKYVVLQSVEREIVQRCLNVDFKKSILLDSIKVKGNYTWTKANKLNFFSDAIFKIPLTNLQYNFFDKPFYSKTYKVELITNELFSGYPDNLLFYEDDIKGLKYNNDKESVFKCNVTLNKINDLLLEKGITLIVLISPDKYDLYYPYIKNKNDYKEPLFFSYFNVLPKKYKYINAKENLTLEIKKHKDLYYYDDVHWSPVAASIIAQELKNIIIHD